MCAQHKNSAFLRVKHGQLSPTNVIWPEVMCATLNPALNIIVVLPPPSWEMSRTSLVNRWTPHAEDGRTTYQL